MAAFNQSPIKGVLFKSKGTLKHTFPFLDSYVLTDIIKFDATIYIASTYSKLLFFNSEGIIRVQDVKVPENNTIDKVLLWNKEKIIIRTTDETGFKYAYTLNLETGDLLDLRKKYSIYTTISDVFIDNEYSIFQCSLNHGWNCSLERPTDHKYSSRYRMLTKLCRSADLLAFFDVKANPTAVFLRN